MFLRKDRSRIIFEPNLDGTIDMGMLERIKPVSWFKANAAEVLRNIAEDRTPYIITQNGEARAVVQDIASYEATQETLALLRLVAMGEREVAEGRVVPFDDVVAELRARRYDGE